MKNLIKMFSVGALGVLMTATAFGAASVPDPSVPDGGATLGLLALAVVGLAGYAWRRAK